MFSIIIIIIIFFSLTSYLSGRFKSPYTLTYIFGLKGAGKSTFMAKLMRKDLKAGWTVYTNMDDIKIPGVRVFDTKELIDHAPPPKSALYIDEAGLVWDNRKYDTFDKGYTAYFKLQRKYKNKVVMNSQALDVDKKIRDLVDKMYLVSNLWGVLGVARPLKRTIKVIEATGNNESRLALNLEFQSLFQTTFFLMPLYWKYFNSFSVSSRPNLVYTLPLPAGQRRRYRPSLKVMLRQLQYSLNHKKARPPSK